MTWTGPSLTKSSIAPIPRRLISRAGIVCICGPPSSTSRSTIVGAARSIKGRSIQRWTDEEGYFHGFPTQGVRWEWVALSAAELREVRYINLVIQAEQIARDRNRHNRAASA